jgi:hypothetical protein
MAVHRRQAAREAIGTALTGLTTTGSRVFQSRVYPLETTDLPGLLVYTGGETIAVSTIHGPAVLERTLAVRVVGVARALADLDDTLDLIVKEVEIAIAGMSIAGIASGIALTGIDEPELSGSSDRPTGQVTLNYEVNYFTTESAPDVAL